MNYWLSGFVHQHYTPSSPKLPTMVRVNKQKCNKLAAHLRQIVIPFSEEDGYLQGVRYDQIPNFYFLIVAICHQTSPVGKPMLSGLLASGEECHGWDYLRRRFAEQVALDDSLIEPNTWLSFTGDQLNDLLVDAKGRLTLTDARGRTQLIRELGLRCLALKITRIQDLYTQCNGWLVGGPNGGLFSQLKQFTAYQDPVRKKSCFFLELMRGQSNWEYKDLSNLGAPVDYHEVRGHLRIGTVVIKDSELLDRIKRGREVTTEQDIAIREAVYDAIRYISDVHGACDPATLHYLFWNIFRNCCGWDHQHCDSCGASCKLPQRYREAFAVLKSERCALASLCNSAGRTEKLREHQHRTDYY